MIGTISVGGEKALAAYDHYKQFVGMKPDNRCLMVVKSNGEIHDNYGNFIMDLPIDPVLETIEDIKEYLRLNVEYNSGN